MTAAVDYSIVPVTVEDTEEVLEFLRKFFFRDEPLSNFIKLLEGPDDRCLELEEYAILSIPQGCSLKAVSSEGKLLGLRLNGLLTREEHSEEPQDSQQEVEDCQHPRFRKILRLLKRVYWESNVFKKFPEVQRVLEIRITSVDEAYRCLGIAQAFTERTKQLARELNCQLIRTDCTSAFSAKVAERRGFQLLYSLPYSEHLDSEGNQEFVPHPPHTAVNTYVFRV